ncbi:hypothetical protein BpHYR1_029165 [Brachionus plicatilis]|uniref:Uncharacterized protein n=1 Tax=Brachionus plicatilis TaxID=10195 RepID=A0A3M7RMN5_BRAPC|nr:hypothetical protein BpHYR1_029165 [Brachionus plicatilis]
MKILKATKIKKNLANPTQNLHLIQFIEYDSYISNFKRKNRVFSKQLLEMSGQLKNKINQA